MWLSRYRLTRLADAAIAQVSRNTRKTYHRKRAPLSVELLEDRTTPATITPTTFADGIGIGSLRDAILQANSNEENNTILLSAGTYELTLAGRNETVGQAGDLNLTAFGSSETIQGAGAGTTIINANQIDRVFEVQGNVKLVLSNLTITGGLATDASVIGGLDALGGGILNNGGNVTLDHVAVAFNVAQASALQSAQGGGIYSNGGLVTINDSTITSNFARGGAGNNGLKAQPNPSVSITSGQGRATSNNGGYGGSGAGAVGGGLYVCGGALTISGSLIGNNQAQGGAGGNGGMGGNVPPQFANPHPYLVGTGPFFFNGQTIGGTSSGSYGGSRFARSSGYGGLGGNGGMGGGAQGGGLYIATGTVNISTTTITGNSVTGGAGGDGGAPGSYGHSGYGDPGGLSQGGGVFAAGGDIAILNSTLTGNVANQAAGGAPGQPDFDGETGLSPLGQGVNLFTDGGIIQTTGTAITHKDKIGVVRPAASGRSVFTLDTMGNGIFGPGDSVFQYGLATDQVVSGDWNGSGSDEIGVVRPNGNGGLVWTLDTNGDGVYDAGDQVVQYGVTGDQAFAGDWNGNGKSEIGVARPDGHGGMIFALDTNGDGVFDAGDQVFDFNGGVGKVVVGDWNGAGKDEIGVVRPDGNGSLVWSLDTNGDGQLDAGDSIFHFGTPTDQPIVGDWTGSGRDSIGVVRPLLSQGVLLYTLDANGDGVYDAGDQVFTFGQPGDTVLVGKWNSPGQPLLAAGLPSSSSPAPNVATTQLAPLVTEATNIWMATGLNPQQIRDLQQETVLVDNLPTGLLGSTRGETITLSPDADDYGWFVDPTPADNAEFSVQSPQGFQAIAGGSAAGQMDLLTTILHEEGHVLGLPDLDPAVFPNDVMTQTLAPGIRRMPRSGEA